MEVWNKKYGRKFLYEMEYEIEDFWYGMEMEWKKIASMEYGKIVFHSIPVPVPLPASTRKLLLLRF